jgi:hypothetical protein
LTLWRQCRISRAGLLYVNKSTESGSYIHRLIFKNRNFGKCWPWNEFSNLPRLICVRKQVHLVRHKMF